MSIFSDHDVGALSDEEFEMEGIRMNNRDRIDEEDNADDDVDCEFEYEFNRCNACEDAKHCKKVEVWNGYHGNLVVKAGTMDKIWFDTDEEDYDDI